LCVPPIHIVALQRQTDEEHGLTIWGDDADEPSSRMSDTSTALLLLVWCFGVGAALGLAIPGSETLSPVWAKLHSMIGWTYFTAWSTSFYPQVSINEDRTSCCCWYSHMDTKAVNQLEEL